MINIKIDGLDKLSMKLQNIPLKLHPVYNNAIRKSIFEIQREATPITPWDTGHLRRSLGTGIRFGDLTGLIESQTKYGRFIHEGSRYYPLSIPPKKPGTVRQFLKVGAEKAMPNINRYFDEATKILIK